MTFIYRLGTDTGFLLNKRPIFAHSGSAIRVFLRYLAIYTLGYLVNLSAIFLLEDRTKLPHQLVQAILIVCVAILLFSKEKFWVFTSLQPESNLSKPSNI